MKFYVAASGRGSRTLPNLLRKKYDVVSTWDLDEKDYDPGSCFRAIRDYVQIKECDVFICEVGDKLSGGGKHTELGIAMALGKPVILVGAREDNVFHSLFLVRTRNEFCKEYGL